MIKYFKELENKFNYYLPLVDYHYKVNKKVSKCRIPFSFIDNNIDIFKYGKSLINMFNRIDINSIFIPEGIKEEYDSIKEDMPYIELDLNDININSDSIYYYLDIIKRLANLYIRLYPHDKEVYLSIINAINKSLKELDNITTIKYEKDKYIKLYQPDSWYITPNNYLYNPGEGGHKGRDLNRIYNMSYDQERNQSLSKYYKEEINRIKRNGYITKVDYDKYLNYINKPIYLEKIDGIPIIRNKSIVNLVLGIIDALSSFEEFFENLYSKTDNPKEELKRISELTKDDIRDILIRCCGFHKVESTVDKTITTSSLNYEEEFKDYIDKGWKIEFIPPIIINESKRTIEEYEHDYVIARKLLKL